MSPHPRQRGARRRTGIGGERPGGRGDERLTNRRRSGERLADRRRSGELVTLPRERVIALLLRKQHLDGAAHGGALLPVVDDLLGLHATQPVSPYLQLRSRLPSFTAGDLDGLLDSGRVARIAGMRRTLFIESAELIPLVLAGTRELRARDRERFLSANGVTPRRFEQLAAKVQDALAGRALDAQQLRSAVAATERLSPVIVVMCDQDRLVRWKGAAGWRSARPTYRLFADALPGVDLGRWEERAAVSALIDRYICRYGPVSEADITWWTGFRKATVGPALASLPNLARVNVDGVEGSCLIHEADLTELDRGDLPLGNQVALLPVLDPCLQGYLSRDRWIDERHRPFVVDRGGNTTSVILVDGRVVGVWDLITGTTSELRVLFFEPPGAQMRRRIVAEATATAGLLLEAAVAVVEVDRMAPLAHRTGGFLSPLRTPAAR